MDNSEESIRSEILEDIFRVCRDNGWEPPTVEELAGMDSTALSRELTLLEEEAARKIARANLKDLFGFEYEEERFEAEQREFEDEAESF